ncbi:MAG: hypothetical protein FWG77_10765 [Treponema sp.]|nr:hypothetical protein [Treponema sp.]
MDTTGKDNFLDGLTDSEKLRDSEKLQNSFKLRALLRRRIIEAIEYQFKEGLEFTDCGFTIYPPVLIELLVKFNIDGTQREPIDDPDFPLSDMFYFGKLPRGIARM